MEMGKGCRKDNQNVYFQARKNAAMYNERLRSREGTSESLGISVSALADYELGITKVVPVDKVVLMADLYNAPELKAMYCKNECPIGRTMHIATEVKGIEGAALRLVHEFESRKIEDIRREFTQIALDGEVSDDEKEMLKDVLEKICELELVLNEIELIGKKIVGEEE